MATLMGHLGLVRLVGHPATRIHTWDLKDGWPSASCKDQDCVIKEKDLRLILIKCTQNRLRSPKPSAKKIYQFYYFNFSLSVLRAGKVMNRRSEILPLAFATLAPPSTRGWHSKLTIRL